MSERTDIVSFGGGTQSTAIACLVVQGKLPRPERFIMADTGREASATWAYLRDHVNPMLATIGMEVEIAPHSLATVDLYSLKKGSVLMPVFTAGGEGQVSSYCSSEWKKNVLGRYLRGLGYGPKKPVRTWLGISVDEVHRAKPSGVAWNENHYPLLFDVQMRRDEAVRLVENMGLPTPPKSSCWMCPYRGNAQWRDLRDNWPEDWKRAVKLDAEIRERDPNAFVHRSGVALAEADIEAPVTNQSDLFGEDGISCDSGGYCMT